MFLFSCDSLYKTILLPMICTISAPVPSPNWLATVSLSSKQFCKILTLINSRFSNASSICTIIFSFSPTFPTWKIGFYCFVFTLIYHFYFSVIIFFSFILFYFFFFLLLYCYFFIYN